jgi:hypothetical protein
VSESVFARRRALFAALVVAAAALAVHPTWARAVGLDVWNVPALSAQVRASEAEGSRLADEDDEVRHRIAVKDAIVTDLYAGRLTLVEATDRFTAMNATRPHYLPAIRAAFPGATDREKMARNVISYALPRVPAPERGAAASRFETDLRQMLADAASH